MITKNKKVSVAYELRTQKDGEIVEKAGGETPFVYICGYNEALPHFEQNLLNLNEGDKFEFEIDVDNAYGPRNEDMVIELPMETFQGAEEDMLKVGQVLPMQDSLGRRLEGLITENSGESLTMDFNHPLAGQHLYFTGNVEKVEDAPDEEIEALNAPKCGSCSSCGSSCGGGDCGEGGCC